MNNDQYVRHPSGVSEQKLSKRFGLHWDNDTHDWELIVSDSGRIKDFLKVYQNELNNDDDKFTLMGLIVSSFDDAGPDYDEETFKYWDICKIILENECYLHYSIIEYWSFLESELDEAFPISPLIRKVWEKVKVNFL